jgi:hypothetical protein
MAAVAFRGDISYPQFRAGVLEARLRLNPEKYW